ncbi:MAG: hypothetical protein CMJ19_17480 [Phycisphaeraceae bacterium]|nr:hypothetical protein [Phycisphaeraceae bacterium]
MTRVTITQVAKHCGVAKSTVSKVLNQTEGFNVRQEVRDKIMAAAQELNYRPDGIARNLRMSNVRMVMVVGYNIHWATAHGIYETLLASAIDTLRKADVRVYMDMNQSDHHQDEWSATMMHGALVLPGRNLHIRQFIEQMNVPHVTINDQPMHENESCVCVDDYQGAVDATEHLIKLGHRRIVYKDHINRGGDVAFRQHYSIPDRRRGYVDAMRKHGLDPMPGYDLNVEVEEFLDRYILAQRATAVLAWENTQAVQLLRLCEKAGIDIPGDLNIACFNEINYDSIPTDFVTVVDLPTEEMGRKASELLLKQMDEPSRHVGKKLVLPETLRVRRSTCALPKTSALTTR